MNPETIDQEKIQAHNDQQQQIAEENAKTESMAFALKSVLDSQKGIEQSVRESILQLVRFISKNQPKVSVTNQQPFPKYDEVVTAVKEVVAQVKNSNKSLDTVKQKEVDLSGVVKSLDGLSKLVAKLPTNIPVAKSVEISNQKDYSDKFDEVTQAVGEIPAPIVNVEKPVIPDNSKDLEKILKAVEKIKFPDIPETDLEPLIEATKKVGKTIASLSFPVPNYVLPFKNSGGAASQVQLNADGTIPTSANFTGTVTAGSFKDDPSAAGEAIKFGKRNTITLRPTVEAIGTTDRTKIFIWNDWATGGDTAGLPTSIKPLYIMEAATGSALVDTVWQVQRLTWARIAADVYKVTDFMVKQNIKVITSGTTTSPWASVKTYLDSLSWTL